MKQVDYDNSMNQLSQAGAMTGSNRLGWYAQPHADDKTATAIKILDMLLNDGKLKLENGETVKDFIGLVEKVKAIL